MGAVEVSPLGGFRHKSVFGPAVRLKYSMHCGRSNVGGRFSAVNEEPFGGILVLVLACYRALLRLAGFS